MKKSYHRWKIAFFLLLIPVITVSLMILSFIFSFLIVTSDEKPLQHVEQQIEATFFTVQTTKAKLNDFLAKQLKGNYAIKFEEDYGVLSTSVSFLSMNIPTEVIFIPEKQEDGNLQLNIRKIKLAGFRLPEQIVLQYIKESSEFPSFVQVDSANKIFHVLVTEVEVMKGLFLYVNEFNLKDDEIIFILISKAGE